MGANTGNLTAFCMFKKPGQMQVNSLDHYSVTIQTPVLHTKTFGERDINIP